MTKYSQQQIELLAKDKSISSIIVRYNRNFPNFHSFCDLQRKNDPEEHPTQTDPIEYDWSERHKIRYDLANSIKLMFVDPNWYWIDGDWCKRPGFRVKKE